MSRCDLAVLCHIRSSQMQCETFVAKALSTLEERGSCQRASWQPRSRSRGGLACGSASAPGREHTRTHRRLRREPALFESFRGVCPAPSPASSAPDTPFASPLLARLRELRCSTIRFESGSNGLSMPFEHVAPGSSILHGAQVTRGTLRAQDEASNVRVTRRGGREEKPAPRALGCSLRRHLPH